jgi:ABC-type protease/lipase transport system fused ATPase/permease subunit
MRCQYCVFLRQVQPRAHLQNLRDQSCRFFLASFHVVHSCIVVWVIVILVYCYVVHSCISRIVACACVVIADCAVVVAIIVHSCTVVIHSCMAHQVGEGGNVSIAAVIIRGDGVVIVIGIIV